MLLLVAHLLVNVDDLARGGLLHDLLLELLESLLVCGVHMLVLLALVHVRLRLVVVRLALGISVVHVLSCIVDQRLLLALQNLLALTARQQLHRELLARLVQLLLLRLLVLLKAAQKVLRRKALT